MEKVKLPREVADAIGHARTNLEWTDGNILAKCVRGDWELESMQVLNNFCKKDDNKLSIAHALINGYEVEQTPEDKVRELFRVEKERDEKGSANSSWILTGALRVLEAYNIKISGVNDI